MPEWLRAWLRGWALLLAGLAAFAVFVGVPHVLMGRSGYDWAGGGAVWTHCRYLGPLGTVEARPGYDVYEECPSFALLDWKLAFLGKGRK